MRVKHFISKCLAKSALVSLTLSLFLGSLAPMAANAANITAVKDTMTRLKIGNGGTTADASSVTSNHIFSFTLPNAWNSGDTVFIDFSSAANDFLVNATSNWAASDFTIDGLLNTSSAAETEVVQLGTFAYDATPTIAEVTFPACSPNTTADVVVSGLFTTTTNVDPIFGFKRCASAGAEGGTAITITFTTEAATNGQIENPSSSASQKLYVCFDNLTSGNCDDTAYLAVGIATDDQVVAQADVDPSLTFRVGKKTANMTTNCNGSFTDATDGGTMNFGVLSLATVYHSGKTAMGSGGDSGGTPPLCTLVSTNATGGAAVTVIGSTTSGAMASTSVGGDTIDSAAGPTAMSTGTENFGVCVVDSSTGATSGTALTRQAPFSAAGGNCLLTTSATTNMVGGNFASGIAAQTILSQTAGPSNQAYSTISMNVNVIALTEAHDDYTITLTFIATGTF